MVNVRASYSIHEGRAQPTDVRRCLEGVGRRGVLEAAIIYLFYALAIYDAHVLYSIYL